MAELPTKVGCHMCEQKIDLVFTKEELERKSPAELGAFPVVPCTGAAGAQRTPTSAEPEPLRDPPRNGAANGYDGGFEPEPAPPREPSPPRQLAWTCTLANGEMISVDKDTMIIGRSRTCDIVIQSAKVSRQHASVSNVDGELYIEDLGSANGVWFNGEKVTRAKIGEGDSFTISDETLTFESR